MNQAMLQTSCPVLVVERKERSPEVRPATVGPPDEDDEDQGEDDEQG